MLIFALFAMSLDLLLGYAGLASLGHAAFFGVAAYAIALLILRAGLGSAIAFPAALVAAATTGAVFAVLALRARGSYFLMITFALSQVVWSIAFGWRTLTNGDDGMPGVPRPNFGWSLDNPQSFYYFVLAIVALATLLLVAIVKSPFGRALRGIRESELRMQALGYDVWRYQFVAFVLAATFAGLAGALYAYLNRFVSPDYCFVIQSAEALIMVILGGPGTLIGPAIGGALIVFLEDYRQLDDRALAAGPRRHLCPGHAVRAARPHRAGGRLAPARRRVMTALAVADLSKNFGGVAALADLSLEIGIGERRVLLGPNGAGKTTLFHTIAGYVMPSSGRISLFGRDITRLRPDRRARLGLARTFQITNLFPRLDGARQRAARGRRRRAGPGCG